MAMETYHGHVRTPQDAIILFEACRLGLLPRVQRRLSEKERQNIKSGSIFVWDEREAGMRRWTDGKSWSASRVSGSFLTYREMEGKRGGGNAFAPPVTTGHRKSPNGDSDSDHIDAEGPDGYRYKPDGLMKQSFSITTSTHQKLHLISYYARSHPNSMTLMQPSQDPSLKHIRPAKGMYPESTVHEQQNVPIMTHTNNASRPPAQVAPQYSPIPPPVYRQPQSATHPHSYSQPLPIAGSPYQQQQWLPSPTSTPPTAQAGLVPPQYALPPVQQAQYSHSQSQLPPPLPTTNGHYIPSIEGSPQQPQQGGNGAQRGTIPSPMMHLRSIQQQPSPRLSQEQHLPLQRQQSIPPMEPLSSSTASIRYSSPGASSHTSAHTPPRSADTWEMNPIRGSPDITGRSSNGSAPAPNGGEISPSAGAKLLPPQDIPSEKIFSNEDVRTLRMLDKAFVA